MFIEHFLNARFLLSVLAQLTESSRILPFCPFFTKKVRLRGEVTCHVAEERPNSAQVQEMGGDTGQAESGGPQ